MVADTVYMSFYSVKEIAELRCAYDHFVLKIIIWLKRIENNGSDEDGKITALFWDDLMLECKCE